MNIEDILSEIDAEIARLQQAKALLGNHSSTGTGAAKRKPGRPPSVKTAATVTKKTSKRRTMSPEGRARIAAAQKARWAKTKKATGSVAKKKLGRPAKKTAAKKLEAAASNA